MSSKGFSLVELLIAVSLSAVVLLGVASISANVVQVQVDGIRSGQVTGWSVVSYTGMVKEIEEGTVLAFPIANGAAADAVIVCRNWSRAIGGALPGGRLNLAAPVAVIQYCMDPTPPTAPETGFRLRRYSYTGAAIVCPSPAAPVAGCPAAPGAPWTQSDVVGFRFDRLSAGMPIFTRDNSIGGVRIRYVMGNQNSTPTVPVPKFTPYNIGVTMNKAYNSTLD